MLWYNYKRSKLAEKQTVLYSNLYARLHTSVNCTYISLDTSPPWLGEYPSLGNEGRGSLIYQLHTYIRSTSTRTF